VAGQRIFITGGASGLGQALAVRYARAGWRVCVGDLDEARCAETLAKIRAAGGVGHALACDVRKEADLEAARRWLETTWGGVDVVVNNAGVAVAGGIADTSLADWQWIIDINLLGVVRGCKVFTPLFQAQRRGRFVNVASQAGLNHPPRAAAYNATKAAVVAISETLEVELERDGIGVSVVCPAFFRTNLHTTMRAADARAEKLTHKLVGRARRSAESVADQVFEAVARGDFYVLTHRDGQVAWLAKRLLPHGLYTALVKREYRRMEGREATEVKA
jgi:NAD(P)-dependent dehydrogenase (short-subunit alcohol dehydrogenase family)